MAQGVRLQNLPLTQRSGSGIMRVAQGIANTIDHNRKAVLASPLVFALLFGALYVFCGPQLQRVIDFMAPGHLFGR
jgi:hypothetical protein